MSFTLPTDSGDALISVPRDDHRPLVLDFFGPTCHGCEKTVPALVAKRAEIEALGAQLVLVGILGDGESTEDARRALASWGVRAPFLKDNGGVSQRELKGVVRWVAPANATAEDVIAATR